MLIAFLRTILLYIIIIFAMRFMGKRQIGELQASEFVITLLVSNIAAIPMQNATLPLIPSVVPIFVLVVFEILISHFMVKNLRFRKFVCGSPIVVINDGKLDPEQLKNLRINIEDLYSELRQAEVGSIKDVAYGIIETNGNLSIIKKPEMQEPTIKDLGIKVKDNGIETVVVRNGEVCESSLSLCKLSREWLLSVLKEEKLNPKQVFIMTANKNKEYNIIKKGG